MKKKKKKFICFLLFFQFARGFHKIWQIKNKICLGTDRKSWITNSQSRNLNITAQYTYFYRKINIKGTGL